MRNLSRKLERKNLIIRKIYILFIKIKENKDKIDLKDRIYRLLKEVLEIQNLNKTFYKLQSVLEGLKEKIQDYQL